MHRNRNWTTEFSPNNSMLYVSAIDYTFSFSHLYDISSLNLPATKILIDSHQDPGEGSKLKLSPDGNIYWTEIFDD